MASGSLGSRSSAASTLFTWRNSASLLARQSGCVPEQGWSSGRFPGGTRRLGVSTTLCGKKSKKGRDGVEGNSSNWYDDEEKADLDVNDSRAATGKSAAASNMTPSAEASNADGAPQPFLHGEDDTDIYEVGDDGSIVLEPFWPEGETPIVERYGLNAALGTAEDNILPYDNAASASAATVATEMLSAAGDGGSRGTIEGVSQKAIWAGGMELPEDFGNEEGRAMIRDLDDMLMERSIRFYDPKVFASCVRHVRATRRSRLPCVLAKRAIFCYV